MAVDQMAFARSMLVYLDGWANKPADFDLEDLSKEAPAAMLMHIPTSGVLRKYIDGSYLGEWSFVVMLRINKADTSEKLAVFDLFADLWKYFTSGALPVLPDGTTPKYFELLNTPSASTIYDNGTEDYQTNYRLVFHSR